MIKIAKIVVSYQQQKKTPKPAVKSLRSFIFRDIFRIFQGTMFTFMSYYVTSKLIFHQKFQSFFFKGKLTSILVFLTVLALNMGDCQAQYCKCCNQVSLNHLTLICLGNALAQFLSQNMTILRQEGYKAKFCY